ncbi:MAG: PhnA domain-containing protein [Xanthomonadaceae bacterium]|nr:PhnA domain-containing protein [Xanthomonadaceae bacterium]
MVKGLKVKGALIALRCGTPVRNTRLTDDAGEIECNAGKVKRRVRKTVSRESRMRSACNEGFSRGRSPWPVLKRSGISVVRIAGAPRVLWSLQGTYVRMANVE